MSNATRRFRYVCPSCGTNNEALCRKCGKPYVFDPVTAPGAERVTRSIAFPKKTWEKVQARVKVTPGVSSPSEYVRLAVYDMLNSMPERVIQ